MIDYILVFTGGAVVGMLSMFYLDRKTLKGIRKARKDLLKIFDVINKELPKKKRTKVDLSKRGRSAK